MDSLQLDPSSPAGAEVRTAVGVAIGTFLDQRQAELAEIGDEATELLHQAQLLGAGGKRLRPAFCLWGYVAATGDLRVGPELITAAASLDLLHLSALVHDDVMDESATRRGRLTSHKQFEQVHSATGLTGDPVAFGRAAAILLGDLLLMWSVEMLHTAQLPIHQLMAAAPLVDRMRTEVTVGQYLDVFAQANPLTSDPQSIVDAATRVVEFKTARYTVVRPLQFGAALGGANALLVQRLEDFASPLGRAFQFRDDLLGVFGDSEVTGKPAGDDLREGKRTALLGQALADSGPAARQELLNSVGRPDVDVGRVRELIANSGAIDKVEAMIGALEAEARSALDAAELPPDAKSGLSELVTIALRRES